MLISPKVRGFICTNAHPEGCAANVREQINYVKQEGKIDGGPARVLVIGSSTGYGLASRIVAGFACGASTLGLFFEKPGGGKRTGSAGFYNSLAFHQEAEKAGLYARSINGDAFSHEIKQKTIEVIKRDLEQVDLVVYSLASPRRTDPDTGETYNSTLKPVGQAYTAKNLNTDTLKITDLTLEPASEEEIANTVKVMGGEDWELWLSVLKDSGVLAKGCKTVAYTYLGEKITWPIYGKATIGKAKEDLDRAAKAIGHELANLNGSANVCVLKAIVTQASSAIPIMPLYLSALYKVMKEAGTHEGCIEQLYRLFTEGLYTASPRLDDANRLRVDDLELMPEIQQKVEQLWNEVTEENLMTTTDYAGHHADFLKLFGFGVEGVDYDADVDIELELKLE